MSTTNFNEAIYRDLLPMPLTHDLWTSGISSATPSNFLTSNSVMSLGNNNFLYSPEQFYISDIPPFERQMQPLELIQPMEGCSLLSESSVGVRDAACSLPGYHFSQMVGTATPQLRWQASVYKPSLDVLAEKPTENIWDMLVGLLGTEQGTDSINISERSSTAYLEKKNYFTKADVCITSLQAGKNQEEPTDVGYQNSIKVLGDDVQVTEKQSDMMKNASKIVFRHKFHTESEECHCEEITENGPLSASQYSPKSLLVAPDEKVNASKRSETIYNRNNNSTSKRASDLVPDKDHKGDQLSTGFMHLTKIMQPKSINSKSSPSMPKQRKKLRKTKHQGKVSIRAKDKLSLTRPEAGEKMAKQKPRECLSFHPVSNQTPENEQFIKDPVIQLPRIVDNVSLNKITSIKMQCCDEKEDAFMWRNTMMKFLNPFFKYERLHSLLMNNHNDDENYSSSNVVIKLNEQPMLALESCNNDIRSMFEHMKSFNQNSHATALPLSAQVSESQSAFFFKSFNLNSHATALPLSAQVPESQSALSKSPKMSQITNLWNITDPVSLMKPLIQIKSLEDEEVHRDDTFSFCKTWKSPFLQGDCSGLVPNNQLLTKGGWNDHSNAQVCLQEAGSVSNQFAATMEESFSPECQLKLLLHAGHCQLSKVWLLE